MDKVEGFKWHLIAKTAGKGDPDARRALRQAQPEDRAKAEAAARKWFGTQMMPALTPAPTHGTQSRIGYATPARLVHLTGKGPTFPVATPNSQAEIMLHSALINVMVKAARRAGRSLKRDLGEIENLQVSLKGPANFVTNADRRAEEMLYEELLKARPVTASSARKAAPAKATTRPTPGSSIRSTAPPISCTAFRNSRSRSACSAKAHDRRRDLQSGQ